MYRPSNYLKKNLILLLLSDIFPGAERFSRDVELMLGRGVPIFMRICWCFITPAALLVTMLFFIFLLIKCEPLLSNMLASDQFCP